MDLAPYMFKLGEKTTIDPTIFIKNIEKIIVVNSGATNIPFNLKVLQISGNHPKINIM